MTRTARGIEEVLEQLQTLGDALIDVDQITADPAIPSVTFPVTSQGEVLRWCAIEPAERFEVVHHPGSMGGGHMMLAADDVRFDEQSRLLTIPLIENAEIRVTLTNPRTVKLILTES